MKVLDLLKYSIKRYPSFSLFGYAAFVLVVLTIIIVCLIDVQQRLDAIRASAEALSQFEQRAALTSSTADLGSGPAPPGAPLLEGHTETVASAALIQRITSAILRAGGRVISTELETQSVRAKDGYVRLIANGELEERSVQQFLFDIERGMPFIFIERLVVQAPSSDGRLRLQVGVSAMWQVKK